MKRWLLPPTLGKWSSLMLGIPIIACLAQPSPAASVTFNPAGTGSGGSTVQVGAFDELPGNALAVGGQTAINSALAQVSGSAAGTQATSGPFTIYYQANLALLDPTGHEILTPGFTFTAVAKFNETATVTNGSSTVIFNLASSQTGSYFDFFATKGTIGDNPSGHSFATDNPNATLIYTAGVTGSGPNGNFTSNGGSTALDAYPSTLENNSQQTVSGFGGSVINFATTSFSSNYFVTNPGPVLTFTTQNITPFTAVDPSAQFVNLVQSGSTITSFSYVTPNLGSVNGSLSNGGSDFQFQADANSSFATPEPASIAMTLIGLGGMGLGTVVSRRRAKGRATVA